MKTNDKKLARISKALNGTGISFFRCESCDCTWDAKRNLQGRTHHVDDDAMRYFGCRILNADKSHDNLVFWLIESTNRPNCAGYNKRFVAFDVFGNVITKFPDDQEWHRTSDKAMKQGREWLASFDAIAHTEAELTRRMKRQAEEAKRVLAIMKETLASQVA